MLLKHRNEHKLSGDTHPVGAVTPTSTPSNHSANDLRIRRDPLARDLPGIDVLAGTPQHPLIDRRRVEVDLAQEAGSARLTLDE